MKKTLILLSIILLIVACSRSDDASEESTSKLNPPTWLQGNWKQDNVTKIIVTNDNFRTSAGGTETNWGEFFKTSNLPVVETVTESKYTIKYGSNGIYNYLYFTKKSSNQMYFSTHGSTSSFYLYDRY